MIIEFTFGGEPVPAMRPRVAGRRAYTPPKYKKYKEALANAIKKEYGYFSWDIPEPNSKERTKYLANNRYILSVNVYRRTNRGDADNFLKSVQDALQDSGVIADDSQIDRATVEKFIDKENPRIELILEKR